MSWRPFSEQDEQRLMDAISEAESDTSGEIRVHIDRYCKTDPLLKAKNLFVKLEMNNTERSNGVLFYISVEDKKFAIFGDKGINEKVEDNFWTSTVMLMTEHFKQNNLVGGICAGVLEAGKRLKVHFPIQDDDTNELSNEITYS
ncbi:MAG: TPM domain-containing protein [Flavobacteriales bacterium]|nr:TPM domain-containing protein [Flavobacteriales bacterium]